MRFFLCLFLIVSACATKPTNNPGGIEALSRREYRTLVDKNTRQANQYAGFYQTFQADATLLTTELQTAQLKERAQFMQWDQTTYNNEREKALQESSAYAKVFLRFFAPEREYDDLSKGVKSIWKVYMDFNGNRFEGKVRKMNDKLIEMQTLYPHLDGFSTPYEVTFNVPMTTVEQGKAKVTLTSSLGAAEFVFPTEK
ncbi:MAG: hypothetical protein KF799_08600 [Bdellovibrionales bacterium]|nr:hypothetical protein [Bdellovibrionales bacterium]